VWHALAGRHLPGLDPRAARLPEAGAGEGPVHGDGRRLHLHGGGEAPQPAHQHRRVPGRAVRAGRWERRPVGRDQRICEVGDPPRCRGGQEQPGPRPEAAPRRLVERPHRARDHQCRGGRQRRRPVGPGAGSDGRRRAAATSHGAPVRDHRGDTGDRRPRRRAGGDHRLRGGRLHPSGRQRPAGGDLRERREALGGGHHTAGLRDAPADPRPGAVRRPDRAGPAADARTGDLRHRPRYQRSVHVRPGRQPPHRARPRRPELLGGLCGHGRVLPGGWGGPLPSPVDHRRRATWRGSAGSPRRTTRT